MAAPWIRHGIEQALHLVGEGKKLKLTHPTYAEVG